MSDVVDRITARLDAMEAAAKAASNLTNETEIDGGVIVRTPSKDDADAAHIALNDPAAVLAMVAGLRAVVALHPHEDAGGLCPEETCGLCGAWWPCPTLRAVAACFEATP